MSETQRCEQCGTQMAADAPQGLCPQCLMKLGLPTEVQTPPCARRAGQGVTHTGHTGSGLFVPPDPKALADQFPQLEIIELLGQGGMGVVYKARQKQLGRLVALKILPPQTGQDPAFAERFNREARAMARLNHPNIVTVHDFGHSPEGLYYFIMEFVEGTDLRQVLSSKQLAPAEALAVVPQICAALQFAHDEGIVHRDIKPENILLDTKGRVKIADFGLARLMNQSEVAFTLTQADQRMGTPHYMAPEQVEHPHKVDHRADIYSLGVVFYEMLTGELPIGRFDPPSQRVRMDVHLDDVVLHTLEKAPDRRYQHASELKTDVEAISKGAAPSIEPADMTGCDLEAIRHRLKIPAIGLIISGAINIVCCVLLLALEFMSRLPGAVLFLGISAGTCVVGVFIMHGAGCMLRLRSYGWAVTAGILAVLPLSFGFMIGMPMGLWALIVLYRSDVQAAFAANAEKKHGAKSPHLAELAKPGAPVPRADRVGAVSLITAITGGVTGASLSLLFWFLEASLDMSPPYVLCLFAFVGLELIALITGIAGWRSPYGKAGAVIAILFLFATTWFVPSPSGPIKTMSPGPVESHRPVQF